MSERIGEWIMDVVLWSLAVGLIAFVVVCAVRVLGSV
jgi:hypothetical protein